MNWNLYLVGQKLVVPTSAKTVAGYYLEEEPVSVSLVTDAPASVDAIARALEMGNPSIPTPDRKRVAQPPVVLSYAGVKSWSAFVKRASCWSVKKQTGSYTVVPRKRVILEGREALQEDHERGVAIPDNNDTGAVAREIFQVVLNSSEGDHPQ